MNVYLEPPAFGLPSADAESIAVLSYCSLVAPDSFRADYSASADRLVTGFLPTLHDASTDAWVAGFDDIVTYLRQQGLDTDDHLSTGARAEIVAYSSLVERKARDLTFLSLFGDGDNFTRYVRGALARELQFFRNYTRPLSRQKIALARLEELGFHDAGSLEDSGPSTGGGGGGFLFHRKRRDDLLRQARQIRVQKLMDSLYCLLESKLSSSAYLFGARPSSIDCLVFGHLALHLFPAVPNDFLGRRIKDSFPRTRKFLVDFNAKVFDVERFELARTPPWSLTSTLAAIWSEVAHNGSWQSNHTGSSPDASNGTPDETKKPREWWQKAAFVGGAITLLIGFVVSNGLIVLELGQDDESESQAAGQFEDDAQEYTLASDDDDDDDLDDEEVDDLD